MKHIHFLSTVYTDLTIDKSVHAKEGGHRQVEKTVIAELYSQKMAGVDLFDQKLTNFGWPHQETKCYCTIYRQLLEVALISIFTMY